MDPAVDNARSPSPASPEAVVLAVTGLDCATKLRIAYRLPVPVDRDWLARFDDDECRVRIDEFSALVPSALDHVTITSGDRWLAKAVLGLPDLIVTFFRSRRDDGDAEVAQFESRAFAGIGRVVRSSGHRRSLPDAESQIHD